MTDEERAEDYYEDNECYSYLAEIEDFEEVFGFVKDRVIHAYLDGLTEGRKENEKLKTELMHLKGCEQCKDRPKGELATVCPTEYEQHCIGQKMTYIKELEEENAELKKDKEWLDKTDNEQTEVILNLYAQIGKMKCCANCKLFDDCAGDYLKRGFRAYVDELKQPCDEWELAE